MGAAALRPRRLRGRRAEPAYKRLILSQHNNLNRGDYLIDDRTANGAGRFEGELLLFGSDAYPDGPAISARLLKDTGRRRGAAPGFDAEKSS